MRLLTLHNLTYLERLVAGAREAIAAGRFAAYRGDARGCGPLERLTGAATACSRRMKSSSRPDLLVERCP